MTHRWFPRRGDDDAAIFPGTNEHTNKMRSAGFWA
jgi:hypothetical protein